MNEYARTISSIADGLARRTGRCADDLPVRVLAGAVVGTMMAIFLPQKLAENATPDMDASMVGPESVTRIDEALGLLEAGLPL